MGVFSKKDNRTAVEVASDDVGSALSSFLDAEEKLEHATEVYLDEVAANNAYVERLNAQSVEYEREALRASEVAARLGAIVDGPADVQTEVPQ